MMMTRNLRVILPAFFLILFMVNYYDLFFIQSPVAEIGRAPTLSIYVLYNFTFRLVFYAFKFIALAVLFLGVANLWNIAYKDTLQSPFLQSLSLIVLLEYVFFLQKVYRIIYFEFFKTAYNFDDYRHFNPFSLYDRNVGSNLLNYLLKDFSLYDLVYIVLMALGVKAMLGITPAKSFIFVALVYVLPLVVFTAFLDFIGVI